MKYSWFGGWKQFIINANKNSRENVYIQSAKLNGKTPSKNFIRYKDIAAGGVLSFEMAPATEKKRGTAEGDQTFSVQGYYKNNKTKFLTQLYEIF